MNHDYFTPAIEAIAAGLLAMTIILCLGALVG